MVSPPTEPLDELVAMLRTASAAEPSATLSGPGGQHLILPAEDLCTDSVGSS